MRLQPRQHRKFSNIARISPLMVHPRMRSSMPECLANLLKGCNLKAYRPRAEPVFFLLLETWTLERASKHGPSQVMSHLLQLPLGYSITKRYWMVGERRISPGLVLKAPEDLQRLPRMVHPIDSARRKSSPSNLWHAHCSWQDKLVQNGWADAVHLSDGKHRKSGVQSQPVLQGHCRSLPGVLLQWWCSTHQNLEMFAALHQED